jgi:hypothetical protein
MISGYPNKGAARPNGVNSINNDPIYATSFGASIYLSTRVVISVALKYGALLFKGAACTHVCNFQSVGLPFI